MDSQDEDSDNDTNEASSNAMMLDNDQDNQYDNQYDNNSEKIASTSITPIDIIEDQLSERLSSLPEKYLDRYLELQNSSPFWKNLFSQPPNNNNTDASSRCCCPPLKSREWAEFVVDASRIFFEARLPVREVVGIINYTIQWVTLGFLNGGERTIYFEDGRNVFYEPRSGGMSESQKTKYEDFLGKMRATILGGSDEAQSDSEMEVISDSGDESSAASDVSQLEDAVAPTESAVTITSPEDRQGTTDTLPWELSTTPTEVKPPTLDTEERSDRQAQPAKIPPQTENERNRKRQNVKRNERRKRSLARLRKLFSESKDTMKSKADKRRLWRQNWRRKDKMKKRNEAATQAVGA